MAGKMTSGASSHEACPAPGMVRSRASGSVEAHLNHSFDALRMIERVHPHDQSEIGEAERNEAVDIEVAAHCLEIAHVGLNGNLVQRRSVRASAVAHVVRDDRGLIGELFEIVE